MNDRLTTPRVTLAAGSAAFLFASPIGPRITLDRPDDMGAAVMQRLDANHSEVKTLVQRVGDRLGKAEVTLEDLRKTVGEFEGRLSDTEQKGARRGGGVAPAGKTWGQSLAESDEFKALAGSVGQRGRASARVNAFANDAMEMKAITSVAGSGGAMIAPDYRADPVLMPRRRMTIRSLLAPGTTSGSSVQYAKQTLRELNAAPVAEGARKPESNIKFEIVNAPVQTIAHFTAATRQIMDDSPQLMSIVDGELRYGLELVEEQQFLYGDGTGVNLFGIVPQATAYSAPFPMTGETAIDRLALALNQCELALLPATGIVLHTTDWRAITLLKDGMGRYILGDPQQITTPNLWGIPVVPTLAMQQGKFLVGGFRDGAQIFDRMEAEVLVSTENEDFFVRNLVAVRAERRAAMTVRRPQSFVTGSLP